MNVCPEVIDGYNGTYIKVEQFHVKNYHVVLKDLLLALLYDIPTEF